MVGLLAHILYSRCPPHWVNPFVDSSFSVFPSPNALRNQRRDPNGLEQVSPSRVVVPRFPFFFFFFLLPGVLGGKTTVFPCAIIVSFESPYYYPTWYDFFLYSTKASCSVLLKLTQSQNFHFHLIPPPSVFFLFLA